MAAGVRAMEATSFVSPKAALSYQWADDLLVKASVGRAVRMPTVSELYGATTVSATARALPTQ